MKVFETEVFIEPSDKIKKKLFSIIFAYLLHFCAHSCTAYVCIHQDFQEKNPKMIM